MTIREARLADLARIVALLVDDPLGRTRESLEHELPASYRRAFEKIEAAADNHLLVAESGGEIVGTFQLTYIPGLSFRGGTRAQIESVRVDARHRGGGFGTQMMAWAVRRAREEGCRLVQLSTHRSRPDAHRFYERLGFVASHEGMKLDLGE